MIYPLAKNKNTFASTTASEKYIKKLGIGFSSEKRLRKKEDSRWFPRLKVGPRMWPGRSLPSPYLHHVGTLRSYFNLLDAS
jgi:hypothetical protein